MLSSLRKKTATVAPAPAFVSAGEAKYNRTTNTITFTDSTLQIVNPTPKMLQYYGIPVEAWKETKGGKKKKASKPKATKKK